MSEMKTEQEKGFFSRFATFDLVLIAIFVGVWYGVQQIWFIGFIFNIWSLHSAMFNP